MEKPAALCFDLPHFNKSIFQNPLDPDFTLSFDGLKISAADDVELSQFEAFYDIYGFVVVHNVFNVEECSSTRDAMWEVLEAVNPKFVHSDHSTWGEFKATGKYGLSIRGPCFHPTLVRNRWVLCLAHSGWLHSVQHDTDKTPFWPVR